ncbi:Protein RecA [Trichinella spiralis]|uniref:Protein RecA n=1 Tax=Trichinella spiralis TaxID=6334 RepID=A0ABR3KYT9_TRISP
MQKLELALKHLHKRIEILADGKNSTIRMHELGAYRILLLCFLERNHFNDFSSLIFYHLGRLLKIPASCNPFKPDVSSQMHHADSILKGCSEELDNELPEEGNMTDNIFVSDKCRNALLHQAEHLRDCLHTNMKMNNSFSDEMHLDEKNAHLLCIISGISSSFQELTNEKNGITATVSDVTANSDSVASSNDLRKSGGKRKTAQHAEEEPSCLERKRAKILNLKQPVKNKRAADNLDHQNASDNAKSLKTTKYAIMTRKQNREIGQSAQKSSSKGNSSSENEKDKITAVPRMNVTLEMKKKKRRKKKAGKSKNSNKKAIPTSAKPLSTEILEVGKSDSAVSPWKIFLITIELLKMSHELLEQPPLPCNVDSSANCEISQQSEYSESIIQKDKNSVLLSTESPQNTDSSNTVLESAMENLPSIDAQSEPAPLQHSTSIVECLTSDAASSSMINEGNSEPVAAVQSLSGSSSFSTLEIIDLSSYSESASASDSEKNIVIDLTGDDEEYICSNTLFTNAVNETNKETSKMNTDENEPKEVETLLPSPKAAAVCDRNEFASTVNGNSSDVNGDLRTEVNISDKEQNALGISSEAVLVEKVQVSAEEVTAHAKGGGNAVLKASGNQPLLFKKVALLKTALPKIGPDGKPLIIRSYRLLTSKSSVGCDKLRKTAECSATNIRKNVMIIKKNRVCEGNGKLLLLRQNVQMDGEKRNFNANGLRPLATLRDLKRDQMRLSLLMAKFNKVGRGNFKNDTLSASNISLPSTLKLNSTNNGFCESSRAASTIHNGMVDKAKKNVQVLTYVIDDAGRKHYRIQSRPSSVQVVPNEASSSGAAVLDSSKQSPETPITLI